MWYILYGHMYLVDFEQHFLRRNGGSHSYNQLWRNCLSLFPSLNVEGTGVILVLSWRFSDAGQVQCIFSSGREIQILTALGRTKYCNRAVNGCE